MVLFIAIEITGPLEIARAERPQRVNSHPPILGVLLGVLFSACFLSWLCFQPNLCPSLPSSYMVEET